MHTCTHKHWFEEKKHSMLIIRAGMCNSNSHTLQPFREHSCFLRYSLQQYGKVMWLSLLWYSWYQFRLTDKVQHHWNVSAQGWGSCSCPEDTLASSVSSTNHSTLHAIGHPDKKTFKMNALQTSSTLKICPRFPGHCVYESIFKKKHVDVCWDLELLQLAARALMHNQMPPSDAHGVVDTRQ